MFGPKLGCLELFGTEGGLPHVISARIKLGKNIVNFLTMQCLLNYKIFEWSSLSHSVMIRPHPQSGRVTASGE